jgi:hypothetical protein
MNWKMAAGVLLAALAIAAPGAARPVIQVGGEMLMLDVDGKDGGLELFSTLHPRLALGLAARTLDDDVRRDVWLGANLVLFKRNTRHSQANLYALARVGPSFTLTATGRDVGLSGQIGVETDWETRRWFVGGGTALGVAPGGATDVGWKARLGVAPYVTGSGALHTWLFVEGQQSAKPGAKAQVGPVVRLFKGALLVEAGVSHRGVASGTLWVYF